LKEEEEEELLENTKGVCIIQGVFSSPSFSIQKLRVKSELAQVLKPFERSYLIMRLAWAQQQQQQLSSARHPTRYFLTTTDLIGAWRRT
jgi:hypothetical protein